MLCFCFYNSAWGDQLTKYKGNQITYDANGNPLTYYDGFTFEWQGRQLVSAANNSAYTVTFTYNEAGLRQTKTVDGVTTTYNYNGSLLLSEQNSERIIIYMYDGNSSPIGFMCCRTEDVDDDNHSFDVYYYEKNLQGDVIAVRDENGAIRYSYLYNAWGELVYAYAINGAQNTTARYNTIFYRSYYFDEDLCLYYLNTRYYDAYIGRFISPDDISYLGANGDLNAYNLYAYCSNNPVMGYDPYGAFDWWGFAKGVGRIVTGIAAAAAGVAVCVAGAPVVIITVAAVTITAGSLTAVNGAADIQQSVNGNNFVRDTVFNGNQTAYDVYSGVTETIAIVGTTVCGNYLSTNCTMKGAVSGTKGKITLEPGATLDRYGSQYGRYLTDPGTSIDQLALPPGNSCKLTTYVVKRPFTFRTGVVAPCAWGAGGGVQYFSWMSVHRLVQFGFLTPLG